MVHVCVGYNVATHLYNIFALTDLQPDRISVRYHRYPTQNNHILLLTWNQTPSISPMQIIGQDAKPLLN